MSSNNNNSAFNLRTILEKGKLNADNFLDWERNLRNVLRSGERHSVLDTLLPEPLDDTATRVERNARQLLLDASLQVTCLMLVCMEPDFQKRFDGMDAYDIIQQLKTVFQKHARLEIFEANRKLLECKLSKGKPVGPHVFNMIGHFQNMEKLDFAYHEELAIDMVINSLHEGYKNFSLNFCMQGGQATLQELHGILIQAERNIPNEPTEGHNDVLMVRKGKSFKKTGATGKKDKGNQVANDDHSKKQKTTPKPKIAAEHECYYCNKVGHWKRNCPKYLEDKKNGASTLGTQKK